MDSCWFGLQSRRQFMFLCCLHVQQEGMARSYSSRRKNLRFWWHQRGVGTAINRRGLHSRGGQVGRHSKHVRWARVSELGIRRGIFTPNCTRCCSVSRLLFLLAAGGCRRRTSALLGPFSDVSRSMKKNFPSREMFIMYNNVSRSSCLKSISLV